MTKERDPKPAKAPLTAREIYGNLLFTGQYVQTWYQVAGVQWPFRPHNERIDWTMGAAAQYAQLTGHRIIERTTTRPYPVRDWAEAFNARTPQPLPLPDGHDWASYLISQQNAMFDVSLAEKEVYLGVRFANRTGAAKLFDTVVKRTTSRERDRVQEGADRITQIISGGSLAARPLTGTHMQWLMHRSIGLGLPGPAGLVDGVTHWLDDDLNTFTDGVWYEDTKLGQTVKVIARRAGQEIVRHVAVLTLGKIGDALLPENGRHEWLRTLDLLPFPVERVSIMDVEPVAQTKKKYGKVLLAIRDQQRHHHVDHGLDVPDDLARKAAHARAIDAELTDGLDAERVRLVGWHRLAVSGATAEECLARVRAVRDLYQNRITVEHPKGQLALLREFIPGEPLALNAYTRRMPVMFYTAGAGCAVAQLGDQVGDRIATTCGTTTRPVMFDPWLNPERHDASGMYPVIGVQGSGKSTLLAKLALQAVRRNIRTVLLDPSVTFAGLARLPWLAPYLRVIDVRRSPAGTLNPYAVVRNPDPGQYDVEQEWRDDWKVAQAERWQLVQDIVGMLIPPEEKNRPETRRAVSLAMRAVPNSPESTLGLLVKALTELPDPQAQIIADVLRDVEDMTTEGPLFFGEPQPTDSLTNSLITVFTLAGLNLPQPGTPRENWTAAQVVAIPVVHLASYLASQTIYGGARNARKLLVLDEMHFLAQWASGKAFFARLARDTRKWNAVVLAAGQNPADALSLAVENLIGGAFIGLIDDEDTAVEALKLLQLPGGMGYEKVLTRLSPVGHRDDYREFLMLDAEKRVEKIRVTFDGDDAELLAAVNTRATGVLR